MSPNGSSQFASPSPGGSQKFSPNGSADEDVFSPLAKEKRRMSRVEEKADQALQRSVSMTTGSTAAVLAARKASLMRENSGPLSPDNGSSRGGILSPGSFGSPTGGSFVLNTSFGRHENSEGDVSQTSPPLPPGPPPLPPNASFTSNSGGGGRPVSGRRQTVTMDQVELPPALLSNASMTSANGEDLVSNGSLRRNRSFFENSSFTSPVGSPGASGSTPRGRPRSSSQMSAPPALMVESSSTDLGSGGRSPGIRSPIANSSFVHRVDSDEAEAGGHTPDILTPKASDGNNSSNGNMASDTSRRRRRSVRFAADSLERPTSS